MVALQLRWFPEGSQAEGSICLLAGNGEWNCAPGQSRAWSVRPGTVPKGCWCWMNSGYRKMLMCSRVSSKPCWHQRRRMGESPSPKIKGQKAGFAKSWSQMSWIWSLEQKQPPNPWICCWSTALPAQILLGLQLGATRNIFFSTFYWMINLGLSLKPNKIKT